jgi:hypothetical protein
MAEIPDLYGNLSSGERALVEHLLHVSPGYRYELSGLPELDSTPAPGLASVVAAVKAMTARNAAR